MWAEKYIVKFTLGYSIWCAPTFFFNKIISLGVWTAFCLTPHSGSLKYSIHSLPCLLGFLSVPTLVCVFRGRWIFFFEKRVLCSMIKLEIIQKFSLDSCWSVVSSRLCIRILWCYRKHWGSGNSSVMNRTLVSVHQVCLFLLPWGLTLRLGFLGSSHLCLLEVRSS